MAGQQAFGGQVRILDVEGVGTAQQGDAQFPGGILDLVESDAAAACRGILVGDTELFEGEDVMEQQNSEMTTGLFGSKSPVASSLSLQLAKISVSKASTTH